MKRIILIDNYDSFTYNIVQVLSQFGVSIYVVRNDEVSVEEVLSANFDAIVLSPGPSYPDDAGICLDLISKAAGQGIAIFGICLGMQCIAKAFGGKIVRIDQVVHGASSKVIHDMSDIYIDIPQPFDAGRYHSLVVERESLPEALVVTAQTEDEIIMGLRHRSLKVLGVQFHPESILTPDGPKLLENFIREVA